ncbi:MAG: hypothetical protein B6I38_09845 [Anaerolineaceae bacterium 4572_5.1]|nr:MAG: hypothetical protein B6I38_09845 [Anaerolineaceae bacterium 4572_5.1]
MKLGKIFGWFISLVIGSIFAGMGAGIVLLALNIIPVDASAIDAPLWMSITFGLVFFLAGTRIFSMGTASANAIQTPFVQWTQSLLTLGIFLLFGGIFIWIGLKPDDSAALSDRLLFAGIGLLIACWGLWSVGREIAPLLGFGQKDDRIDE